MNCTVEQDLCQSTKLAKSSIVASPKVLCADGCHGSLAPLRSAVDAIALACGSLLDVLLPAVLAAAPGITAFGEDDWPVTLEPAALCVPEV